MNEETQNGSEIDTALATTDDPVPEMVAPVEEDPVLSPVAEDVPDMDPDAVEPSSGMEELRSELKSLREMVAKQSTYYDRLSAECAEFQALYPDVALSELPDKVWDDVKRGIPLAASFALSERKRLITAKHAEESNRHNRERSSGGWHREENREFSFNEVRAMTPAEVRENYHLILESMKKWNIQ